MSDEVKLVIAEEEIGTEREPRSSYDEEMKAIQLAKAKAELRKMDFEIDRAQGFWTGALTNPIVLAAAVTGTIALTTAAVTAINSRAQLALEREKFEKQFALEQEKAKNLLKLEDERTQSQLILAATKTGSPDEAAKNLQFLLRSGILQDPHGDINKYLQQSRPGLGPALPQVGPEKPVQ